MTMSSGGHEKRLADTPPIGSQMKKLRYRLSQAEKDGTDSEFINYLLSPDVEHDTYFLVGNNEIERIGAVKKMLIAHSVVLRCELQDSKLAEKGDIVLSDICPNTFKNLLKYIYGYNKVSILTFDEADNLLYAADKYIMKRLKDEVALRLMYLLDTENICSLLNNPACDTVPELDEKIIEMIKYETDVIFASTEFLNLRIEGFIKILEQDSLCATEIEVWRAALKWVRHKGECEDGKVLRESLSKLKNIRIRTIKHEDVCKEVVPTNILSYNELKEMCIAHGKHEQPPVIEGFSAETVPRSELPYDEIYIYEMCTKMEMQSLITVKTKHSIKLLPLEFMANSLPSMTSYQCECVIEVHHYINGNGKSVDPNIKILFDEEVECSKMFKVPLSRNGRYIRLSPNSTYNIRFTFSLPHIHYLSTVASLATEAVALEATKIEYDHSIYRPYPFKSLKYMKCFRK